MTSCSLCLGEEQSIMFRRKEYCKQDAACPILKIVNFSF